MRRANGGPREKRIQLMYGKGPCVTVGRGKKDDEQDFRPHEKNGRRESLKNMNLYGKIECDSLGRNDFYESDSTPGSGENGTRCTFKENYFAAGHRAAHIFGGLAWGAGKGDKALGQAPSRRTNFNKATARG